MKILILGAAGRIGVELLKQSLERGHQPTAYIRSAGKLSLRDERLKVVAGEIDNPSQLAQATMGTEAVLSALRQADLKPGTLLTKAAATICQAMTASKTRRLIAISRALLIPGGGLAAHFFRYLIRSGLGEAREAETTFRQSVDPAASISRKTLAAFMLDTLDQQKYLRKIVGVTGSR